jgi:hypothetical protein
MVHWWEYKLMSGIICALAGIKPAGGGAPPYVDLYLNFNWPGAVPYNATGASGTVGGFGNYFAHNTGGGTPPYTQGWTVTYNPSGKLSIVTAGANLGVAWTGMAINESQAITLQYSVTDSAGDNITKSDSTIIKRVS